MIVSIEIGPEFKRQFKRLAKKYHSPIDDFESWKNEILKNPLVGDDLVSGLPKKERMRSLKPAVSSCWIGMRVLMSLSLKHLRQMTGKERSKI